MNTDTESVILIAPEKAHISKLNTRQPKPADVAELVVTIRESGQITPAIVRPHPTKKGEYEIAAGARRSVACKVLKRPLRAIVRDIPDGDFEDMILTDNLQRVDPDLDYSDVVKGNLRKAITEIKRLRAISWRTSSYGTARKSPNAGNG